MLHASTREENLKSAYYMLDTTRISNMPTSWTSHGPHIGISIIGCHFPFVVTHELHADDTEIIEAPRP